MKETYIDHKAGQLPEVRLTVRRVEASVWNTLGFDKHHYLTADLNKSCKCLLFEWEGEPVAFVGIINKPSCGRPFAMSISRIVILPDFQGLGLARRIMDFVGGIVLAQGEGYSLSIKTAHDKMGSMLESNPNWRPTTHNGKERTEAERLHSLNGKYKNIVQRRSYCYAYNGGPVSGYADLLLPIDEIRQKWNSRYQTTLF